MVTFHLLAHSEPAHHVVMVLVVEMEQRILVSHCLRLTVFANLSFQISILQQLQLQWLVYCVKIVFLDSDPLDMFGGSLVPLLVDSALPTGQYSFIHESCRPSIVHSSINLSIHPLAHSPIHQSTHLSRDPSFSPVTHPIIHQPIHPSISLSICPVTHPSVKSPIHQSIHLSSHPSITPSNDPFTHPSVYPFIY